MLDSDDCQKLLNKLCVDLGFCLPPSEAQNIVNHPPASVADFTNAIFMAEGLNPEVADKKLYRQIRDRVQKAVSDTYA
jgi:hypothetical protein